MTTSSNDEADGGEPESLRGCADSSSPPDNPKGQGEAAGFESTAEAKEPADSTDLRSLSEHFEDIDSDPVPEADWLDDAWLGMPDRWKMIITRRLAGDTLETIAQDIHVTRERVRQLQKNAEEALVDAQRREAPDLPEQLAADLGERAAIPERNIRDVLPTRSDVAREALLGQLGVHRPNTWSGPLEGYWTGNPTALDTQLRKLADLAPITAAEAEHAAVELGIPAQLPWAELLAQPGSKVTRHDLGWIRSSRSRRDLAYLWLREQGEPRSAGEIASVVGTSEHTIRETMRRDGDFAQVRPEGTWALADWRVPGSDNRYRSAEDVVIEVLRELGPLDYDHLRVESQRRYPVTDWRITQCLSSNAIGLDHQGLYDLTERGATPIEDTEPRQPNNIHVSGDVVGIELTVDHDLLRGSGIAVNRWLTWYLGLRTAPSTCYFDLPDGFGVLTVKRNTSTSQVSSLRAVAEALQLADGCKLVLLLHTDTGSATFRHTCQTESCPA